MSRLLISSNNTILIGFKSKITKRVRTYHNDSKPPSEDDNSKYSLAPVKKNLPRVTKLSFGSRILRSKDYHSHRQNDNTPFILYKLPIIETKEHIFPGFEKVVQKSDLISTVLSKVPQNSQSIALFAQKDNIVPCTDLLHLYQIGTLVSYETWPYSSTEAPHIVIKSHSKIKLLNPIPSKSNEVSYADCQLIPEKPVEMTPELRLICHEVFESVRRLQPYFRHNLVNDQFTRRNLNPVFWSYCAPDFTLSYETARLQSILEEEDIEKRLKMTLQILFEEHNLFTISSQMTQKLRDDDMKETILFNLTRLKNLVDNTLHTYQGKQTSSDGEARQTQTCGGATKRSCSFESKIKERLKLLILPNDVKAVIDDELSRFLSLDKNSAEYGMVQNYLDHLTLVPWGVFNSSKTSLEFAKNILNEDHFGLEHVKDVILEHLAVAARMDNKKGRILCFVGPPGVGKTSIAKSIARALGRKYVRISVGGLDDVCEIKGHRKTYVGAMPGRIIKALQLAKSMDPVFCIDEVDKIGTSWRGDPKSSLLEVFDPEQNSNFLDHFLDVPCDLSHVIFVCTANTIKTINKPLLDRMELVPISGYTSEEKQEIVKNFIIPSIVKSFNMADLFETQIKIDDQVIKRITDEYFTEAGVRKTKGCIEKIFRKCLKSIQMGEVEKIFVTLENMTDFTGPPEIPLRIPKTKREIGLVSGLAAVGENMEGFRLDIECDLIKPFSRSQKVSATGLAGQSLSESSMIAYLVAKKVISSYDPLNKSLEENDVRLHFLEGGQEKDGPSAGIAIFCAILSQALQIPIYRRMAMTGEITLKGNVIAVGGIKQKLSAAVRTGIEMIILPAENEPQYDILPSSIKSKINVKFVNNVNELIEIVFPKNIDKNQKKNKQDICRH